MAPQIQERSRLSLSIKERKKISREVATGLSLRRIAVQLGCSPSTINRKVAAMAGRVLWAAGANVSHRTGRADPAGVYPTRWMSEATKAGWPVRVAITVLP